MTQEEAMKEALEDVLPKGVRGWLQQKWLYAIWLIAAAEWLELLL